MVGSRLSDTHTTAIVSTFNQKLDTINGSLEGCDDYTAFINACTLKCIRNAQVAQTLFFAHHRLWIHKHETGKMRANAWYEHSTSELSKCVNLAVWTYYGVG